MAVYGGPDIVTDGLICLLDAGNSKSYPGSGTAWNDLSGNNNNGTLVNEPTFSSSNSGSIILDGTNDYISIPYIIEPLSIDIWFYMNNRNNFPIIYAGSDTYNSTAWQWSIFNFSDNTYWSPSNSSTIITSSVPINSWINAVIIRKSSSSLIYINGSALSPFGSRITTTGNIYVGKSGSNYMNGRIGSIKLYNKELLPTEINQNYNATKGRLGL
jgi:hypothetical protein